MKGGWHMAHRTRGREWKTRLTEEEYQRLKNEVRSLGMTCQEYGEKTLFHRIALNVEERAVIEDLLEETRDAKLQLRRIGTNLNQMARVANATGNIQQIQTIEKLRVEIDRYGMEVDDIWQSLKQLQSRRKQRGD